VQQGPKLTAGEPVGEQAGGCGEEAGEERAGCAFGKSVALSADGDVALIGGPRQAQGQGAAWVFTRSGAGWSRAAMLTAGPEESEEGRFGRSVVLSADGSTALVGASSDHAGHGAAWMFSRAGSTWSRQGTALHGGEELGEGHFGASAALSADGTEAVIGGPGDGGYLGAAWAFARVGQTWSQQGAKLTGGEEVGAAHFGASVALSADRLDGAPRRPPRRGRRRGSGRGRAVSAVAGPAATVRTASVRLAVCRTRRTVARA
jgi:hypothetical protein